MHCRFCQSPLKHVFINLGLQPSANNLLRSDQLATDEPVYPLKVFVCEQCLLVQIPASHKADEIFTDNYVYFSSYAPSWVAHAERYVAMITERLELGSKSLVVEIASNDGYLLQHFVKKGIPSIGIDPAGNCAEAALEKGVTTQVDFFTAELAQTFIDEHGQADLLLGNNVFAHVPDINDFAEGLSIALKPDGVLTLEFPHLARLLENNQFDTIYDEHFSYFSLQVAEAVLAKQNLRIFDVEKLPTHGGSLRIFACHTSHKVLATKQSVQDILDEEDKQGLADLDGYKNFAGNVASIRDEFVALIENEKSKGSRIAAFGAAAKGNTFLNFCDIGANQIDFVADDTPAKQGLFLPGSHIPIVAAEVIQADKPDLIIILPWNFGPEIIEKLAYTREWGARFVTCIPRVSVA